MQLLSGREKPKWTGGWLFVGAADSGLQLAGLSHLFILKCSVLKSYGSAGPGSASLSLRASL